ncbi:hypothetical protein GCM10009716_24220 [Streptomyces sodiiphilus]|uniref:HTH cro/C1-type domain-containing protein n=1 Tax=Streptomyces sodiiphilus TaxID=226217 RepID=A0ABN2P738_9ACTN
MKIYHLPGTTPVPSQVSAHHARATVAGYAGPGQSPLPSPHSADVFDHLVDPTNGQTLGAYLATRRELLRWSQEKLAERSGVSVRTIRNLETGTIRNPRRSTTDLLLSAIGTAEQTDSASSHSVPSWLDRVWAGGRGTKLNPAARGRQGQWIGPPPDPDPLLGREEDEEQICGALRAHRCVALTGPGGVGKTRLALAVAQRLRGDFRDGVLVFPAGELTRTARDSERRLTALIPEVMETVRRAGEADRAAPWPEQAFRPNMLVLIDNAEHLLEPLTQLALRLLSECPGVALLITSRRPVGAPACRNREVGPLDAATSARHPASVDLFLRRVHSDCPSFDLTDQIPAVTKLCAMLDNMPLAIEFAAQWTRSVPLETLLRGNPAEQVLRQRRELGLPHQRELTHSVRWSYDMLTADQQAMLRHLAALPGELTFERIELAAQERGLTRESVAASLHALTDSSLIQVRRSMDYTYHMLGYVRELVLRWGAPDAPSVGLGSET